MATVKDEKGELLVAGYVRNIEKVYKILNIPIEINDIIYLYQRLYDEWNKEYSSKKLIIDETGCMITFNTSARAIAVGSHIVENGTCIWRIKMKSFTYDPKSDGSPPYVGIIEHVEEIGNFRRWSKSIEYELCGKSGRLLHSHKIIKNKSDCRWNKEGDILEITLDLQEQTLSFKVGDVDYGVLFSNVRRTKWRLALGGYRCENSQFLLL